jgi:SAM-dependent methyltransferase
MLRKATGVATDPIRDSYALARSPQEYERLRAQSRIWESATGRVLDEVGLAAGERCLDAGCGPGETMRLMAERVGPRGRVIGVDVDAALGEAAIAMLRAYGHRQCRFEHADLTTDGSLAGAQFDLVYARLLLYHLPERVAALSRLWQAVAPGGHLVIQDYDVGSANVVPALETVEEFRRVVVDAFSAAGCDVHVGARLPELFAEAGIGAPDATDVAGRLERLADAQTLFTGVYSGVLETAIANGMTTQCGFAEWRSAFARDVARFPDRPVLWPLLIGAWKRKPAGLA